METNYKMHNLDWLHSVWTISTVNPFVHNYDPKENKIIDRHPAPFPESLAHRLIQLYSKKGDIVLDPFAGSGTTNFMALSLFRKTIAYELEEKYVELIKKRCCNRVEIHNKSSEDMREIKDNSISLCITSPPYLNLRKYSDKPDNIGNLKDPYPALKKVFSEVFRVLKSGGYFCVNVSDVPLHNTSFMTTFPYDMIYLCQDIGFWLKASLVWDKGVTLREWNIRNQAVCQNHEYIWVFKKL